MFLPLGDEPNPRGTPLVTYLLIAVNVVVYGLLTLPLSFIRPDLSDPALQEYLRIVLDSLPREVAVAELVSRVTAYDLFVFEHGFRPAAPEPGALFSSMFLHGGFAHLAGNMLFLWIYGDNVEHRLGRMPFLAAYLGTGIAATLFHTVFDRDSQLPLVGASGAISGVLGFYFIWFPHNRVRLWLFLFPLIGNVVYAPARLVLGLYLFVDNLLPFLVTRGLGGGGIAYGAHIGGFVAGLGVAMGMNRREVTARPREYRADGGGSGSLGVPADTLGGLLEAGRFEDAARLYFLVPSERTRRALRPVHSIALGDWLAREGHAEAALIVFQRHLRDYPAGPLAAEAHLGAGLVRLRALGQPAAAYQHLVEVFDLDPDADTARQAREALEEITARRRVPRLS